MLQETSTIKVSFRVKIKVIIHYSDAFEQVGYRGVAFFTRKPLQNIRKCSFANSRATDGADSSRTSPAFLFCITERLPVGAA